jgi:hypothetical protein
MKLLTAAIRAKLPKIKAQETVSDPIVHVKFFAPWSGWTWYITEGERDGDDFRMFGLVEGLETELGYVMLSELESIRGPMYLKIERDLYWSPRPLSQVKGM